MSLFWDILQQNQISSQTSRTDTLEARVGDLERRFDQSEQLLRQLIGALENRFGEDLDNDGRVG